MKGERFAQQQQMFVHSNSCLVIINSNIQSNATLITSNKGSSHSSSKEDTFDSGHTNNDNNNNNKSKITKG